MKLLLRTFRLLVVAGAAAQFAACTVIDPVTGQKVYNLYSMEEEVQLGQSFLEQNSEQMREENVKIDADPKRVAQLRDMVARLAAVSDMPDLPYNVTLYHNDVVNAAAAPGGTMMVFEGLYGEEGLVDPDDENELAAVMAHEIAHVNCRHVTERLSKLQTAQTLATIGAIAAEASDNSDVALIIEGVFVVGAAIWVPSYTRVDESEADRVGLFYMAAAGYDPRAAPRLWRRAYEKSGDDGNGILDIFNTHPADKKRAKDLEAILPHAMAVYAQVKGGYPKDYTPPADIQPGAFNWRLPEDD